MNQLQPYLGKKFEEYLRNEFRIMNNFQKAVSAIILTIVFDLILFSLYHDAAIGYDDGIARIG